MRPIQKTLINFNKIDSYAKTVELIGNKKTAIDLRNLKQDILYAYDKQAPNYCALITTYEDKTCVVSAVPATYWL